MCTHTHTHTQMSHWVDFRLKQSEIMIFFPNSPAECVNQSKPAEKFGKKRKVESSLCLWTNLFKSSTRSGHSCRVNTYKSSFLSDWKRWALCYCIWIYYNWAAVQKLVNVSSRPTSSIMHLIILVNWQHRKNWEMICVKPNVANSLMKTSVIKLQILWMSKWLNRKILG